MLRKCTLSHTLTLSLSFSLSPFLIPLVSPSLLFADFDCFGPWLLLLSAFGGRLAWGEVCQKKREGQGELGEEGEERKNFCNLSLTSGVCCNICVNSAASSLSSNSCESLLLLLLLLLFLLLLLLLSSAKWAMLVGLYRSGFINEFPFWNLLTFTL